jgi:hypothetical protein
MVSGAIKSSGKDDQTAASPTAGRGRKRLYATAAEKQRAYRQRRAARLADGREPIAHLPREPPRNLRTGKELLEELRASGLLGIWKDRSDIGDSVEFARLIRERAQQRLDRDGGAGLRAELKRRRAPGSEG